jgi:hypothetical protein
VQAGVFSAVSAVTEEAFIRDLGGGLSAAIGDVEATDRADTIDGIPKRPKGLFQAKSEGADHPGGDDCDPGYAICYVQSVKSSHFSPLGARFLVAFQTEAFYTMSPKGENSSSEVRRLSVGIHSAAI